MTSPASGAPGGLNDPVALARALIRCRSVTPVEGGALDLLQSWLAPLGFDCQRLTFDEPGSAPVENLYARLGREGPNFCFAGHTDVVPVGDPAAWRTDPFAGTLEGDRLIGRGAVDMKGAIASFLAALAGFLPSRGKHPVGSVSLLITGDEEGDAVNGTCKVLDWLAEKGERLDACLVGEPTSQDRLGDVVKIGRRGSLTARLTVHGVQGHTAYPHLADNPIHRLLRLLTAVTSETLDAGSPYFPPSNLQVTSVDVGNETSNVIPARAEARFNVRFNDHFDSASLERWLRRRFDAADPAYDLAVRVSGESFLCPPGPLSDLLVAAVEKVAGLTPALETGGGTSDARFIRNCCPVIELGLRNETAHKVDEAVEVADLHQLRAIYQAVLDGFFSS